MLIVGVTIYHAYSTKLIINTSRYTEPNTELKKTIKCDPTLFLVLGCETEWNTFNPLLINKAKTQDLDDVINLSYIPHDQEAKLLFFWKKSYDSNV